MGKRALLLGAVAQSIPDFDIIASIWNDAATDLLAHRGFTHSFLFVLLVPPLLAWLFRNWYPIGDFSFKGWAIFFAVQLFIHDFIDGFNAYGVGWFEPFSHLRVSFNVLFVADPLFSIWPGIGVMVLLIWKIENPKRIFLARLSLIFCALYLAYCLINKMQIDASVKRNILYHHISARNYFSTPTPFNNWLWFIVVNDSRGSFIGHRSVFDADDDISFRFFPRQDSLLIHDQNRMDVKQLIRFSKGFYTVEKWNNTLVFNDLRFGQMIGWTNPSARFVFHYYLDENFDNRLVLQRGRFSGWDWEAFQTFIKRMGGRIN